MSHREDPDLISTPWYFAYGANMNPKVLERRRITPEESRAARLDGYAMRFSQRGLPLLEPAFANLEAEPKEHAWVVVHKLPPGQLARLDRFEGSDYGRISITVVTEDGPIEAQAYFNPKPVQGRKPSRRYARVCIEGAAHFGLPADYTQGLRDQPTRYIPIASELLTLLIWALERIRRVRKR